MKGPPRGRQSPVRYAPGMRPFSPQWHGPAGDELILAGRLCVRVVPGRTDRNVIFLHGLGASLRYWGRAYDALAPAHRLIFVDLLGFGGSAKPAGLYDRKAHVGALIEALEALAVSKATVVGHSAGALIAIAAAASEPSLFEKVIGFGTPLLGPGDQSRRHLRSLGPLARLMADDSPLAERMCRLMCDHRSLARKVAPLFAPRLPAPVAADGVDHTWPSYFGTFHLLADQEAARRDLRELKAPISLAYGRDDRTAPSAAAEEALAGVGNAGVTVASFGDHHLPLRHPAWCREFIRRALEDDAGG